MWFVYMLRCADSSLYTGITTNVLRRVHEHNTSKRGSRYTRARRPVRLLLAFPCLNKSTALKAENQIKALRKLNKEALVDNLVADMTNIFSLKREALREIVGAVNTCLQKGDVVCGVLLTEGHDTAIVELTCGANLIMNLGVIGKDHVRAMKREQEELHKQFSLPDVNPHK